MIRVYFMKLNDFVMNESKNLNYDDIKNVLISAANKINMPYIEDNGCLIFNFPSKSKAKFLNREYLNSAETDEEYNDRKASLKKEDQFMIVARLTLSSTKDSFLFEINNGWDDLDYIKGPLSYVMNKVKSKNISAYYNDYIDWTLLNKFYKSINEVLNGDNSVIYPAAIKKIQTKYQLDLIPYAKNKVKIAFKNDDQNIKFLQTLVKEDNFKISDDRLYISKGKLKARAFTDTKTNSKFVIIEY